MEISTSFLIAKELNGYDMILGSNVLNDPMITVSLTPSTWQVLDNNNLKTIPLTTRDKVECSVYSAASLMVSPGQVVIPCAVIIPQGYTLPDLLGPTRYPNLIIIHQSITPDHQSITVLNSGKEVKYFQTCPN